MSLDKESPPIRIAIIGTGGMAPHHASYFHQTRGCRLIAGVDVSLKRLKAFVEEHNVPEAYSSTTELLSESDIDAVVIVTPDAYHQEIALECIRAGKHVLCEKPLALNYQDAKAMADAAGEAGVINMVHFTYRNWAPLQEMAEIVLSGEIGEVRHVEASYQQSWLVSKAWGDWKESPGWLWRLSTKHGSSGVLGDVGVHILDFATFPVGSIDSIYCQLKTFEKAPGNRIGEYVLDANDTAVMTVEFSNGAIGSIQATRWMTGHMNRLFLKVSCTKGSVSFDSEISENRYQICKEGDIDENLWKTVCAKSGLSLQQRFVESIRKGKQDQPDFGRGAEIQKLIDASFRSNEERKPVRI